MASQQTVARVLAIMQEVWPRDVTPELVRIYGAALSDVGDDELLAATKRCLRTCRFFATPAELRDAAGANRPVLLDVDVLLERLEALGQYLPTTGTRPARIETVRQAMGDAIAEAYGLAGGGDRLFSGNETTRAIARREFQQELVARAKAGGLEVLPFPLPTAALSSGAVHFDRPTGRAAGFARLGEGRASLPTITETDA